MKLSKELNSISKQYLYAREQFFTLMNKLKNEFNLTKDQKTYISFGIIESTIPELQKYNDTLNSNIELQTYSSEIESLRLKGELLILKYMLDQGIIIPDFNIKNMISDSNNKVEEIHDFILSLSGYQHINTVNDEIIFEDSLKEKISHHTELNNIIELWINGIEAFYQENEY